MNPISQQLETVDLFDRLPDEMVRSIFNKLHDAKSLCLSMAVCKRFHSIAPQIDQIFLHIPKKKVKETDQEIQKGFFKGVVLKNLIKPINFLAQMMKPRSKNDENDDNLQSFHVPSDALKSFDEIRKLHLRLPCYGNAKLGSKTGKKTQNQNPTSFLKWKAEFGRELQSCVLLGAKSVSEMVENEEKSAELRVIAEEELKLRIVWTISCIIAASARHYLIQDIVKSQKLIENVVISDESDQGKVFMNKEQIEEVKEFKGKEDDSEYRSRIPALKMKMWYMEKLELPGSGKVMEGATLVVIRPAGSGEGMKGCSETELVDGAFGEGMEGKMLEEAVKKLMVAKKCYTLEMNSF